MSSDGHASESRHFVVALCGPPGAGKTTLIRALRHAIDAAAIVYYDDFQSVTAQSTADMTAWFARGADPNEFELATLVDELTRTSRKAEADKRKTVLFETPFGRKHRGTGRLIDLLVWVEVPLDVALARQIKTFCAIERTARQSNAQDFVRWLEGYATVYIEALRTAYLKQRTDIGGEADVTIDNEADVAGAVAALAGVIRNAMRDP